MDTITEETDLKCNYKSNDDKAHILILNTGMVLPHYGITRFSQEL